MDEGNIRRLWRQALVPGIGKAGLLKLMNRKVAAHGNSQAIEIAAEYLVAGGTEVIFEPSATQSDATQPEATQPEATQPTPYLTLRDTPRWGSSPAEVILLPNGILYRLGPVESAEIAQAQERESASSKTSPMVAGTLLALCCQRLLLDEFSPGIGRISFPIS